MFGCLLNSVIIKHATLEMGTVVKIGVLKRVPGNWGPSLGLTEYSDYLVIKDEYLVNLNC